LANSASLVLATGTFGTYSSTNNPIYTALGGAYYCRSTACSLQYVPTTRDDNNGIIYWAFINDGVTPCNNIPTFAQILEYPLSGSFSARDSRRFIFPWT
jgi:hypothetical protein